LGDWTEELCHRAGLSSSTAGRRNEQVHMGSLTTGKRVDDRRRGASSGIVNHNLKLYAREAEFLKDIEGGYCEARATVLGRN
jgi:hypothetical protein